MAKQYNIYGIYIPRYHKKSRFYQIFANHFEQFLCDYHSDESLSNQNYALSDYQIETVQRFLLCQDLKQGFGVAKCPNCGIAYIVPFSCKKHKICPSCRMKKLLEYSEWLKQEVLLDIKHRHWVFTIPKELRCYFFEGFNVHGVIKDTIVDYEVKSRLCQYMMRGVISNRNIIYYEHSTIIHNRLSMRYYEIAYIKSSFTQKNLQKI